MQQSASDHFLKNLRIIHFTIIGMVVLFSLIMFGIISFRGNFMTPDPQMTDFYFMVCILFTIAGIALGNLTFYLKVKSVNPKLPVKNKLESFKAAYISRITLLAIPAFFAVISYILTANNYFFLIVIFMLAILFIVRPQKNIILRLLKITENDLNIIETSHHNPVS